MAAKAKPTLSVQSCLVSVSFPDSLDGVLNMVEGNKAISKRSTDLDLLMNFKNGDSVFWTAPKWLTKGDIIFFYQTKRAKIRTSRLLAEVREKFPRRRSLIETLTRAKEKAELYGGSVFACASVAGVTELFEKREKHFVSRLFAPLKEVHIFESPLRQEAFADYVKIGRSTITPLFKKEFNGIKKLLSEENDLPNLLRQASLSDKAFKNVNARNWHSISCLPGTHFIHEAQLRAYLVDFLLSEMKDRNTPLLEECECFRDSRKTGRADYFVRIFGQWIPVEVKLDIFREKRLFDQAAKYMNISSFSPAKGVCRIREFKPSCIPLCVILDRAGMYLISQNGKFIKSEFRKPFWKRENFTKESVPKIREAIQKHFW